MWPVSQQQRNRVLQAYCECGLFWCVVRGSHIHLQYHLPLKLPMTNLSPTGGCYYLLLPLPRTIITEHIHSQQGSAYKNYNFLIFLISKSENFHYFPPRRQSGWATSGSSLNKAGVVQYFRMNNSKAFHNCWRQIKFPSRKGRNANFLISDSVGL